MRRVVAAVITGLATGLVVAGFVGGGLAGCAGMSKSQAVDLARAVQGDWTLTELVGHDLAAVGPRGAPTFSVAPDGKVSGFAGVNRIASSLDMTALAKGQFTLSPMISTKMAGPPEAMALEQAYTSALASADGIKVRGDALELTKAGDKVMRFARGGR